MTDEHQAFMIESLIWNVSNVNGYNFNINSYIWEVHDCLMISKNAHFLSFLAIYFG